MNRMYVVGRSRGFSLLELLIALAITGSVVALIFAGFGAIGRSEQRSQELLGRAERMSGVSQWLQRKFDTLRPLSRFENGQTVLFFSGNPAGIFWIAPLPERGAAGGLHVLRLGPLRHASGQIDLSVEALPYDGSLTQLDWSQAVRETLLKDITTLQWHYFDGKSGVWTQEWPSIRGSFPSRVRLEMADNKGPWPSMVFVLARAR